MKFFDENYSQEIPTCIKFLRKKYNLKQSDPKKSNFLGSLHFCVNDFVYSSKGRQQTFGFIAAATMKTYCSLSKCVSGRNSVENFLILLFLFFN